MSEQASIRVTIVNRLGLHARPAMAFVDLASTFDADINVHRVDDPSPEPLDGKSIMHVMMLAATQHSELQIDASGPGAEGACAALAKLVKSGFGEH